MGLAIGKLFDVSGLKFRGTAFAVSPTRALTAFHCVAVPGSDKVEQKRVLLRFLTGFETEAIYMDGSAKGDYAILGLESRLAEDLTIVPLMIRPSENDRSPCDGWPLHTQAAFYGRIRCGGYPEVYEDPELTKRPDITYIGGEIRADESQSSIFGGIPAIELYSPEISGKLDLHGMSGGPVMVWAEKAGGFWAATGLVRWNPPDPENRGLGRGGHFFASPVSSMLEVHQETLEDIQIIGPVPRPLDTDKPFIPRQHFEPEMVPVPAGPFLLGSDHAPEERPHHRVELPAFCIGKYPVTNEEFYHYISTNKLVATSDMLWDGNYPYPDQLKGPVIGVTWNEALAYCSWLEEATHRKYSLPTEAQWEKAVRGPDGHLYPWGNEWEDGRCNRSKEKTPVDDFGVQSVYGCCDMVGNAREWTLTKWGRGPGAANQIFNYPWAEDGRNDPDQDRTMRRVFRGGWYEEAIDYRCSARDSCLPAEPGPRSNPIGFRVALSLGN